jgi:hypothetical protein
MTLLLTLLSYFVYFGSFLAFLLAMQQIMGRKRELANFLRLWEATGEEVWKNHALTMMNSCAQLISRPGNLLDRSPAFIGYQPEKMNQTDWNYLLLELGGKGSWDTCVAWVVVLTLGAMLDIRERFPSILNFDFDTRLINQLDPSVF